MAQITMRTMILFWLAAIGGLCTFIWLFGDILLPFVTGAAIAYLLNPILLRLVAHGMTRRRAALLLLGGFFFFVILLLSLTLPLLVREMNYLIAMLPGWIEQLHLWADKNISPYIGGVAVQDWPSMLSQHVGQMARVGLGALLTVINGGSAVFGSIAFVALMPFVAYLMMKEWPVILKSADDLLPRRQAPVIRDLIAQIDVKIARFIRGQLFVCFLLAVYYAIALTLIGLKFGVLVGLITGMLSIIPFVGAAIGFISALLLSLFQLGTDGWLLIILTVTVFGIGQFVEGNFITPKIVGESVGLHPLWVVFALLAGGSLAGVLGMLLAVPTAAAIAVLVDFGLRQYRKSPFYLEGMKETKNVG